MIRIDAVRQRVAIYAHCLSDGPYSAWELLRIGL